MAVKAVEKSSKSGLGSVVAVCKNCKPHVYQDKAYGGKRLQNRTKIPGRVRCTVCSSMNDG